MNLDAGRQIRSEPPRARDAGRYSGLTSMCGPHMAYLLLSQSRRHDGERWRSSHRSNVPAGRGCARPRRGGLRKTNSTGASERASAHAAASEGANERAAASERACRPRRPAGHAAAGAHQDCVRWCGERAAAAHGEQGAQEQESQNQRTDPSVSAGNHWVEWIDSPSAPLRLLVCRTKFHEPYSNKGGRYSMLTKKVFVCATSVNKTHRCAGAGADSTAAASHMDVFVKWGVAQFSRRGQSTCSRGEEAEAACFQSTS